VRARADAVALARALLRELAAEAGQPAPALAPRAEAAIAARPWPGNIRELKTALRVALALADGPCIDLEHLPADGGLDLPAAARGAPAGPPPPAALADVEGEAVRRALAGSDGNLSEAARQLGVARSTLYRMMERHGLR
jgi:DNA-binding NtrC family response regulator